MSINKLLQFKSKKYITFGIISILCISSIAVMENNKTNFEEENDKNNPSLLECSYEKKNAFATDDWNGPTTGPAQRSGHSLSPIWGTDKILLFGGRDAYPPTSTDYNDTWLYDMSSGSWSKKTPYTSPGKIIFFSLASIHGTDKVLLFGGCDNNGNRNSDTWIYDMSENNWKKMSPKSKPSSREQHKIVSIYGDDKVLLFGGSNKNTYYNDTWVYDFSDNNWTRMYPVNKPSARSTFSMATLWRSYKTLLYGGSIYYGHNSTLITYKETWIYDYRENNWTRKYPYNNPDKVAEDAIASMWGTDKALLFYRKYTDPNYEYETWTYDLSDNNWTEQSVTKHPKVYDSYAMASGWDEFKVVFYGGFNMSLPTWHSDKTYVYKYSSSYTNDIFIFKEVDTGKNSKFNSINWTEITSANTNIRLQIRTASSKDNLAKMYFVGPNGTNTSFYTTQPSSIWVGHNRDRWIQVKAYFNTLNSAETPKIGLLNIDHSESEKIKVFYWNSSAHGVFTQGDFYQGTKNGVELSKKLISITEWDGELVLKPSYSWSNGASGPSRRSDSLLTPLWGTDNVLLFGGWGTDDPDWSKAVEYNDTWIYDSGTNSWIEKSPPNNPKDAVNAEMSAICDNDKVVLFNGNTWIYDLSDNNWTKKNPNTSPSSLNQPEMAHINGTDKILLIGTNGGKFETWTYDLSDNNWTKLTPNTSPGSSADLLFSPIWGTDKAVLFNGDAWEYDYSDNNWTKHTYWNEPNSWSSSMASIWGTDRIILFHQDDLGYDNSFETWEFDLSDRAWTRRNPTSQPAYCAGPELTTIWGTNNIMMYGGFDQFSVPPFTKTLHKFSLTTSYNNGNYISIKKDTENEHYFINLSWNGFEPENTSLKFQLRSADSNANLSSKQFVGPDGKTSSFYTTSPSSIWSGHDGDRFIQYKVYFMTSDKKSTPRLRNLTISYSDQRVFDKNKINLLSPIHQAMINDSTPLFTWSVPYSPDFIQTAFQLIIDDDIDFSSIEYDSGLQNSTSHSWQFPNATNYTKIPDGSWYCKVRIKNDTGNLSSFSDLNKLIIDTFPPFSFIPVANYNNWTNQSLIITYSTSDNNSGIDRYEVNIDQAGFTIQTSPFQHLPLNDGMHNVTVRAFDRAGNYIDGYVPFYFDKTPPAKVNVSTNINSWTVETQHSINFSAYDVTSGIDYFQVKIDNGDFINQTSPCIVSALTDGVHNITIRAFDNAGNYRNGYINLYIDTVVPNEIDLTAVPSGWTTNKQPTITFTADDITSGIDYYKVKIDNGIFLVQSSPYILPALNDGEHNITVRAFDKASNFIEKSIFVYIDSTPPAAFNPIADPDDWTSNNQPIISFTTIDITSGIAHYEVKIDNNDFETQTSPFTLPPLDDGVHNITVRAFDNTGNYFEALVHVYIDTESPLAFTPTATPDFWTANNQPVITFEAWDLVSDIDHFEVKIDDGDFSVQTSPYKLPALSDGIHNITIRAFDMGGNYIDGQVLVYIDTIKPEKMDTVVTPTTWTSNIQPIVTFSATDSKSGIDYYEVKIDDGDFYIQTSPYQLPKLSDGIHKITVRAYDNAGNYLEKIINSYIDTTSPYLIEISADSKNWTTNKQPIITFSAIDNGSGIDYYELKIDNGEYSTQSSPFKLPDLDDGIHNITVRAHDQAGNYIDGIVSVFIDTIPPEKLSIIINDDVKFTNSTKVNLVVNAIDRLSGLKSMSFSYDNTSWTPWQPFENSVNLELEPNDGQKTIYFRVIDNAGNTAQISEKITLDLTPPYTLSITINDGAAITNTTNVSLQLRSRDELSGVHKMSFSFDGNNWTSWMEYSTSINYTIPTGDGLKEIFFKTIDKAGNIANSVSTSITLNTTKQMDLVDDEIIIPDDEKEKDDSSYKVSKKATNIFIIGTLIIIITVILGFVIIKLDKKDLLKRKKVVEPRTRRINKQMKIRGSQDLEIDWESSESKEDDID